MFKYEGVGAEDYGPPAPTAVQQAQQAVYDVENTVKEMTGLNNFAMYLGVALIGWVAYSYYNE